MSSKRQQSIAERKKRILAAAKEIISRDGFEALTTRELARKAGVTAPTLYNLLGDKETILLQIVTDTVEEVWSRLEFDRDIPVLEMSDAILDAAHAVAKDHVGLHRQLLLLLDRFGMSFAYSEHRNDAGSRAARRSVEMVEHLCESAMRDGLLRGKIASEELSQQMFVCYRGPLRDWAEGVIDGSEMLRRQKRGFYMVLASDACDRFRDILIDRIQELTLTHTIEKAA